MNLVDVAKQEGLDKDIALDILTKCIPHNKSLSLFTETFMVEDIPGVFAEKLINAYNNSQVNLKTGSVISPSEELSKIKKNYYGTLCVPISGHRVCYYYIINNPNFNFNKLKTCAIIRFTTPHAYF